MVSVQLSESDAMEHSSSLAKQSSAAPSSAQPSKQQDAAAQPANGPHNSNGAASASAPIDMDRFLSKQGASLRESGITKLICGFAGLKDVVRMHGGLPPAAAFPISSISFKLADGGSFDIEEPTLVEAAQQYNTAAAGYEPLRAWAEAHVTAMHSPPSPHDVIITTGSNHAVDLVMQLVLNRGDPFLVEGFAYSHLLEGVAEPHGYTPIGVPIDDDGIVPSGLRQVLEEWQASHPEAMPRVLFTVPVGHNPTGLVTPLARKQEVYDVCCEYDLLLLEDDPYYVLQFRNGEPPGLQNLGGSYLSIDTQGRVLRFESASKFLAPGFRVGWAALPPQLARKLEMALFASSLGPTPFSQVVLSQLLATWGQAGLEEHVRKTQAEYWRRASALHEAASQELAGLAEWQPPQAGMFMWVRLLRPPADEEELIASLREHRVVVVPGRISHVRGRDPDFACPYLRICWSYCDFAELREGMRRLAAALRTCRPAGDGEAGDGCVSSNGKAGE